MFAEYRACAQSPFGRTLVQRIRKKGWHTLALIWLYQMFQPYKK
jgi:hypothetical protein